MNWNYPTTIWFGAGKIEDLATACSSLKIKSPLFVTDKDLLNLPMTSKVIEKLKKDFDHLQVFSQFSGNPTGKNVMDGVSLYIEKKCDGVIAFGGGSALDVGKGIAFMCGQKRPIWDFEDIGDYWTRADENKISPIIAVPTTAGTGSETGRASAIINEETGIKKIIFHPKILPSIVILDPNLTKDLPPRITAATGMDALAHNLEAFCAPGFHPMADGIALEGMRLIKNSLIEVYKNGTNIEARSEMLAASSMGSTAFQKGLGAIHSLSHPINAQFDVHHGLSNAIFMPYVLTFNKSVIEKRIISICNYLNLNSTFESFLGWILNLRKELNIPHKLSDVMDCNEIDLEKLSLMAFEDPSTGGNPKKITKDDLKEMYKKSISGELF
ncbi:iron-containing alcohol dehydrogenase [Candidatus Pelagibacter sp. HIMB1506]|uniref:iron-containing alcohol dehydrogenase n=1 Tax=Candidatus Pelagibacter sp. HIMB1506 TaxID=3413337 RepID=UPI003F85C40C